MQYVASAEQFSTHPIAQSVLEGYAGPLLPTTNIQEFAGEGILAEVDGKQVLVGNHKLMEDLKSLSFKSRNRYIALSSDRSKLQWLSCYCRYLERRCRRRIGSIKTGWCEEHSHVDGRLEKLLIISGSK